MNEHFYATLRKKMMILPTKEETEAQRESVADFIWDGPDLGLNIVSPNSVLCPPAHSPWVTMEHGTGTNPGENFRGR